MDDDVDDDEENKCIVHGGRGIAIVDLWLHSNGFKYGVSTMDIFFAVLTFNYCEIVNDDRQCQTVPSDNGKINSTGSPFVK